MEAFSMPAIVLIPLFISAGLAGMAVWSSGRRDIAGAAALGAVFFGLITVMACVVEAARYLAVTP